MRAGRVASRVRRIAVETVARTLRVVAVGRLAAGEGDGADEEVVYHEINPELTREVVEGQRLIAELHLALGTARADCEELAGRCRVAEEERDALLLEVRRLRALRCHPRGPAVVAPAWALPVLAALSSGAALLRLGFAGVRR